MHCVAMHVSSRILVLIYSADFEKGFIRAETVAYNDYVSAGSFNAAKDQGLLRLEGKEYIVCEGDIMTFRFAN